MIICVTQLQSIYETILKFKKVYDKIQLCKFFPSAAIFHDIGLVIFLVEVRQNFTVCKSGSMMWTSVATEKATLKLPKSLVYIKASFKQVWDCIGMGLVNFSIPD